MGKIIQLSEHSNSEEYNVFLDLVYSELGKLDRKIFNHCAQLAISGKLKKWSDEQPVGSKIKFDRKMLREAGDENIKILLQFSEYILDLRKRLKRKPGISSERKSKK